MCFDTEMERLHKSQKPMHSKHCSIIFCTGSANAETLGWASCHFRFWSVVDHAKPCGSMKMEVPGLADSLQQCLCVNSGIYAGDVLDTDPGWQQSKLIWALSAEVGSASRMHCTGLWHVKAAQQPFFVPSSVTTHVVGVEVGGCLFEFGCGMRGEGFMGIAECSTNVRNNFEI